MLQMRQCMVPNHMLNAGDMSTLGVAQPFTEGEPGKLSQGLLQRSTRV